MAVNGELAPGFPREKNTRAWVCKKDIETCTRTKPCPSCRGARNRRSGLKKQRMARKVLERVTGVNATRFMQAGGNEENWRLPVRVEVKSGVQCGPVWTKFAATEAQSNAAKSEGDTRPFVAVFMGTRTSDGLFVCRLTQLDRVVEALVNELS